MPELLYKPPVFIRHGKKQILHNKRMKAAGSRAGCDNTSDNIKSVTVVRMEVPCCGGIENAVKRALTASGKFLPWRVVTVSTSGEIID